MKHSRTLSEQTADVPEQQSIMSIGKAVSPILPADVFAGSPGFLSVDPESEGDEEFPEVGSVVAAISSTASVSFFSSALFHLIAWSAVAVVCHVLGIGWRQFTLDDNLPLSASLSDQEIADQLPQFEFVGDIDLLEEAPASSIQQLARQLQQSDAAWLRSADDEAWRDISGSKEQTLPDDGGGVLLKIPESGLAVTKGSFTAFTIPANPEPRKNYMIVIEVRLPDDVRKYRVNDLTGEVRGSDGYKQRLPFDQRSPSASGYPAENDAIKKLDSSTILDVVKNRVQIVIKVPGAQRLVKDEIQISSRKLREKQELTLIFGAPASPQNSSQASGR